MAYINKIVVNGQEVNANQFEGILDKDGHARFIEGAMTTPLTENGVTYNYAKWSLSGSHLMIVLALSNNTESDITIPAWNRFSRADNLPSWILNKIVGANGIVSTSAVTKVATDSITSAGYVYSQKDSASGPLAIYNASAITLEAETNYRIQIDLIIDNASA